MLEDFPFIVQKSDGFVLTVRVQPNAKRSGFEGIYEKTALKIALKAPPVDGKANEALIQFLADFFDMRKKDVELISGQTSRLKRVFLHSRGDDQNNLIKRFQTIL